MHDYARISSSIVLDKEFEFDSPERLEKGGSERERTTEEERQRMAKSVGSCEEVRGGRAELVGSTLG